MSEPSNQARDDWLVENIRFTSFLAEPVDTRARGIWWSELTGEDSQRIQKSDDVYSEIGPYEGQQLTLGCQSDKRLDWVLNSEVGEPDDLRADLPTVSFRKSLDVLLPLVEKWLTLNNCPAAKRLALGVVLLQPVDTKQQGYEKLGPYLEKVVTLDPAGSSDFRYTINRRRNSEIVPDLEINRLTTWFVWVWKRVKLSVRMRSDTEVTREQETGEQQMACRLDMDINTVAEFQGEFTPQRQGELLQELSKLATEIAVKGDVA